jgi:3-oxoacyl-[acyl-carrier protein] reductase
MSEDFGPRPLNGKVALLTGAVRRNGLAAAHALSRDGAAIIINTRKSVEAGEAAIASIKERGGQAKLITADITDEAQVKTMFKTAIDTFGSLDILINNAADRTRKPFLDVTYAEWQHYAHNVTNAAFLCSREAIPHMLEAGWGSIVNIAGINAFIGTPECEALCVAKGGLIAFTKSLAREFAPRNIRVNAVAPGRIGGAGAQIFSVPVPKEQDAQLSKPAPGIPVGREGYLEEVAETVRWLCQPSQGFITGMTLHINGGEYLP